MVLKVNPLVLGDGIPLFAASYGPLPFALVDSTRYASGVVVNEYVRRPHVVSPEPRGAVPGA